MSIFKLSFFPHINNKALSGGIHPKGHFRYSRAKVFRSYFIYVYIKSKVRGNKRLVIEQRIYKLLLALFLERPIAHTLVSQGTAIGLSLIHISEPTRRT